MSIGVEGHDPYLFPDIRVLRNKLNIRDTDQLDRAERLLVTQRISEGAPPGNFDLAHLQRIHRHLFQDVYDWAGEVRTVELFRDHDYQFQEVIPAGVASLHQRLVKSNFLRGSSADEFSDVAGGIIGQLHYTHPFREGNERTHLQYLKQLGERAGHEVDLTRLDREKGNWIDAAIAASFENNFEPMEKMIRDAITLSHEIRRGRDDDTRGR